MNSLLFPSHSITTQTSRTLQNEAHSPSCRLPFYSQTTILIPKINQPDERPEKAKLNSFNTFIV